MNIFVSLMEEKYPSRFKQDVPMSTYTTFKIGGPAEYFVTVRSSDELQECLEMAHLHKIPAFVLGGGSNILVSDKGIKGLVIKNMSSTISLRGMKGLVKGQISQGEVFVEVDSGVMINQLVRFTIEEGLAGLEMHLGLPGTVGGAIYMNSKWTKPEGYVGDVVTQAKIFTKKGSVDTVEKSYFKFGYDQSILQDTKETVLTVTFGLTKESKDVLWERANESIGYRRESQPQGKFSPGCTFRNLSKAEAISVPTPGHTTSAGFLIDKAGLKGKRIGDAQISDVHGNFITNLGKATARDVIQLIELARHEVKSKFGVTLEEEVVRVGEF